jgi:hypothetical protein
VTQAWTPETWRELATMKGKAADEGDFSRGIAVFYQQGHPVEPVDMPLPHPAVLTLDNNEIAVVIIQAERTHKPDGAFETHGALGASGEHFVFGRAECRLTDDTDFSWLELTRQHQ